MCKLQIRIFLRRKSIDKWIYVPRSYDLKTLITYAKYFKPNYF